MTVAADNNTVAEDSRCRVEARRQLAGPPQFSRWQLKGIEGTVKGTRVTDFLVIYGKAPR
jgi:hypothetical protein